MHTRPLSLDASGGRTRRDAKSSSGGDAHFAKFGMWANIAHHGGDRSPLVSDLSLASEHDAGHAHDDLRRYDKVALQIRVESLTVRVMKRRISLEVGVAVR